MELNKREYEKNLKFKEIELEDFRSQAEDLLKSKDSKKKKMTNLNSVINEFIPSNFFIGNGRYSRYSKKIKPRAKPKKN